MVKVCKVFYQTKDAQAWEVWGVWPPNIFFDVHHSMSTHQQQETRILCTSSETVCECLSSELWLEVSQFNNEKIQTKILRAVTWMLWERWKIIFSTSSQSLRCSGASIMFSSHGLENLEMEQFRLLQVIIFSVLIL